MNDGCNSQTSNANPSQEIISLEAEIPEALFGSMQGFLQSNPQWDQYRLMQAALAGFLLQQGVQQRDLTRRYVSSMFGRRV